MIKTNTFDAIDAKLLVSVYGVIQRLIFVTVFLQTWHARNVRATHIHTYSYIYIYIYNVVVSASIFLRYIYFHVIQRFFAFYRYFPFQTGSGSRLWMSGWNMFIGKEGRTKSRLLFLRDKAGVMNKKEASESSCCLASDLFPLCHLFFRYSCCRWVLRDCVPNRGWTRLTWCFSVVWLLLGTIIYCGSGQIRSYTTGSDSRYFRTE